MNYTNTESNSTYMAPGDLSQLVTCHVHPGPSVELLHGGTTFKGDVLGKYVVTSAVVAAKLATEVLPSI